jgi:stringent starvation protein B
VRVPPQHIKDGKIVLNAAPHAVKDFFIQNEGISFSARFGGVPMMISAPMVAVLAIYARENGQGMFFDSNEEFGDQTTAEEKPTTPALVAAPVLASAPPPTEKNVDDGDEAPRAKPAGRPSLSVVK